jgi:hypothetical protein
MTAAPPPWTPSTLPVAHSPPASWLEPAEEAEERVNGEVEWMRIQAVQSVRTTFGKIINSFDPV